MSNSPAFRLGCERLEARDVPAALLSESFEAARLPAGYSSWGLGSFAPSAAAAADGVRSLASDGPANANARVFSSATYPANSPVSVKLRSDAGAPLEVIARGHDLSTYTGSYLAATLSGGSPQLLTLTEVNGSARRTLATLTISGARPATWLTVILAPVGSRATVRMQRADTGDYLSAAGTWQSQPTEALTGTTTSPTTAGQVGVARQPGGAGPAFADTLTVESPQIEEGFDATAAGGLPAGWAGFTDGGGFGAAPGRAVSQPNALASSGGSRAAARAWPATPLSADQRASVSVYADGLIPAGVFLRGQSPGQAASSYYSVTVVRGVEVQVTAVVDGVETRLASVKSASYLSGIWLDVTAVAQADAIRALVRRLDTGAYLDTDGSWRDGPRPAITATNSAVPAGGFAGVIRAAKYAGTATLDNFRSAASDAATSLALDLTLSQPSGAVSGPLVVTAAASPASGVTRVEFRLDGTPRNVATASPASWALDADALSPGLHTIEVRALTALGDSATRSAEFTVASLASAGGVAVPRHYSHIRVAALAYAATPFGDFETARLGDSVDLVVPNTKFAQAVHDAAPATPQLVYSNVSNLYQDLLSGWLGYAARTGADREAAFYHAAAATPFTGGSPSSQPVTWFWTVDRDGTDLTAEARGGRINGVSFSASGGAVTVAHVDRFREVNVTLDSAAGAGWKGVWEYATAVDSSGKPTAWKALNLLADSTAGFTKSGQVTFDPPKDWAGGATYAIRVRTASGSATSAPIARSILGRDYVNANGTTQGTIPAFDKSADRDGDGYLSDAEYANHKAGFDARFVSESRLFYPYYGQMRFATNPSSAAVRAWAGEVHAQLMAANPLAGGIFLDNSNGRLPVAGLATVESTSGYSEDYAALVTAIEKATPGKFLLANTAGGRSDSDPIAAASSGTLEEFALRPTDATWAAVNDLIDLINGRVNSGPPGSIAVIDSHPGTLPVGSDRVRAGMLAYYYIVGDPERTALMMAGGYTPSAAWRDAWIDSLSVDVGQPIGGATVWASGVDPANASLTYQVFRRDYGNAISLYKPRSYATGKPPGTIDDDTATTHDLGGNFKVLNPDGTLGPTVTKITLRNGEGVVLMRA